MDSIHHAAAPAAARGRPRRLLARRRGRRAAGAAARAARARAPPRASRRADLLPRRRRPRPTGRRQRARNSSPYGAAPGFLRRTTGAAPVRRGERAGTARGALCPSVLQPSALRRRQRRGMRSLWAASLWAACMRTYELQLFCATGRVAARPDHARGAGRRRDAASSHGQSGSRPRRAPSLLALVPTPQRQRHRSRTHHEIGRPWFEHPAAPARARVIDAHTSGRKIKQGR